MKAADVFGLIVRVAGLWLVVEFVLTLPSTVGTLLNALGQLITLNIGNFFSYTVGLASLLAKPAVGYYCLTGAPAIMRLAYPPEESPRIENKP
jgi:hypothetical protein